MKIPVKVYEEIKFSEFYGQSMVIEWVNNNGINTPYKITIV
jgi:hypothetical protein